LGLEVLVYMAKWWTLYGTLLVFLVDVWDTLLSPFGENPDCARSVLFLKFLICGRIPIHEKKIEKDQQLRKT
jgi:hypothetical protein